MDNVFDLGNLSPIEVAKRLKVLKSLANNRAEFDRIQNFVLPEENVERVAQILSGMEKEDEFAILCRLMGTCEAISEIGQSPIIENNEIPPDFLACFAPDCTVVGETRTQLGIKFNCFVEVKSSKKPVFKISERDLSRRMAFANRYNTPLVFAIRFMDFEQHAFWVLVEANRLAESGRKVEINDFIGNLNAVLFDDYFLYTHPDLHVVQYYDSGLAGKGIFHEKYGVLRKTVILLPDGIPLVIEKKDHVLVNVLLDVFDHNAISTETSGSITCVVSEIGMQSRILSDILFQVNRMGVDASGEMVFDAGRVLARFDSGNPPKLISREMVDYVIARLNQNETLLFIAGIGKPEDQKKYLLRIGSTG